MIGVAGVATAVSRRFLLLDHRGDVAGLRGAGVPQVRVVLDGEENTRQGTHEFLDDGEFLLEHLGHFAEEFAEIVCIGRRDAIRRTCLVSQNL